MKVRLMHPSQDYPLPGKQTPREEALIADLGLYILFQKMSRDDKQIHEMCRSALLQGLDDPENIRYRQEILRDTLENPAVMRKIYALTKKTLDEKRNHWWGISSRYPESVVGSAVNLLEILVKMLREIRSIAVMHGSTFRSRGMTALFSMLEKELQDDYFKEIMEHLDQLAFSRGVLVSARIGKGNIAQDFRLHKFLKKSLFLCNGCWHQNFLSTPGTMRAYPISFAGKGGQ